MNRIECKGDLLRSGQVEDNESLCATYVNTGDFYRLMLSHAHAALRLPLLVLEGYSGCQPRKGQSPILSRSSRVRAVVDSSLVQGSNVFLEEVDRWDGPT
jgi:hypothetical protein